jgi:hypothetical protein
MIIVIAAVLADPLDSVPQLDLSCDPLDCRSVRALLVCWHRRSVPIKNHEPERAPKVVSYAND